MDKLRFREEKWLARGAEDYFVEMELVKSLVFFYFALDQAKLCLS